LGLDAHIGPTGSNDSPIGLSSIALGHHSLVQADYAVALGPDTYIGPSGANGIAIGQNAQAIIPNSLNFPTNLATLGSGTDAVWSTSSGGQLAPVASTARIKKNIRDLEDMTDIFNHVKPRRFEYRANDQTDIGFIAEEVFPYIPELTPLNADGEPDSVKYSRMSVLLYQALQQALQRISSFENKVIHLETRLDQLESHH